MSDLKQLLAEEAEHAEQNKDALPQANTSVTQPNRERSKVLSVRLNEDELKRLAAQADMLGIGVSTLARSLVVRGLERGEDAPSTDVDDASAVPGLFWADRRMLLAALDDSQMAKWPSVPGTPALRFLGFFNYEEMEARVVRLAELEARLEERLDALEKTTQGK